MAEGYKQHTSAVARPLLDKNSTACAITSPVVAVSFAKRLGRVNGTLAPASVAIFAISRSSVETTTSENCPLDNAVSIAQTISGLPDMCRIFFRGMRFDPPRAGMTASAPEFMPRAYGWGAGEYLWAHQASCSQSEQEPSIGSLPESAMEVCS